MIQARHARWAQIIFDPYIRRLMNKHFHRFIMVNELPTVKGPLVLTPNHFSWWDGFLIYRVYRDAFPDKKFYIMMLEHQLRRYHFFGKLGAYSIDQQNPVSMRDTIHYTRQILTHNSAVIIYPQGAITRYDQRPPDLKGGLRLFLPDASADVPVVPVAFKVLYGEHQKPDILFRCGTPIASGSVKKDFTHYTAAFTDNLNMLDAIEINQVKGRNLL